VLAPDHAVRLAKFKMDELAAEAERLVAGTGWLPAMLCGECDSRSDGAGSVADPQA
jgi:ParB family chromosome partitioning protein